MNPYARFMDAWETRLAFRSTNRVVRPFEWGLEWTARWPAPVLFERNGHGPEEYLLELNRRILRESDAFFAYRPPTDFRLDDNMLRFTSPVDTPYPENNVVHGQWFPAKRPNGKAVVILPHWNAPGGAHNGLAKGLAVLGI